MPRGTERLAILLAFVGLLAALLRGLMWPWLPKLVPVVLIVTALGLLLIGIVRRVRWHAYSKRGIEDRQGDAGERKDP